MMQILVGAIIWHFSPGPWYIGLKLAKSPNMNIDGDTIERIAFKKSLLIILLMDQVMAAVKEFSNH